MACSCDVINQISHRTSHSPSQIQGFGKRELIAFSFIMFGRSAGVLDWSFGLRARVVDCVLECWSCRLRAGVLEFWTKVLECVLKCWTAGCVRSTRVRHECWCSEV